MVNFTDEARPEPERPRSPAGSSDRGLQARRRSHVTARELETNAGSTGHGTHGVVAGSGGVSTGGARSTVLIVTDFPNLLQVLTENGVKFTIVGGFAGTLHGSSIPTRDLDVVYSRDTANIRRLGAASPYCEGHGFRGRVFLPDFREADRSETSRRSHPGPPGGCRPAGTT